MAINYASKYAAQIDERFSREAFSTGAVNQDYDFVGVKTVNVYSIPTAKMNDYSRTGANRYGTPEELENSVQELTMSQDRSFTFTIDRGNYTDTQMVNAAGAALQRQLREVVVQRFAQVREQRQQVRLQRQTHMTHSLTEQLLLSTTRYRQPERWHMFQVHFTS